MELLQEEARDAISMKWFSENETLRDIYSGPKPRYNVSNAVNVLAGSDDIAAGAILKQCAHYGKYNQCHWYGRPCSVRGVLFL